MNIKKSLKDVIVLTLICVVFSGALAATNMLTKDTIAEKRYQQELKAFYSVMPDGSVFDESSVIDISKYNGLPQNVTEAKKENNGLGIAVKVVTRGYESNLVVVVGVSPDGIVYGATCPSSNETNGVEKTYGANFVDKDIDTVGGVDLVAGSTMTSGAFRDAVADALNAAIILSGGRTEEQKFADAINEALPAGNGEFTKMVLLAAIDGIDSVYEANNGEGYVCVIGTNSKGTFIGVDKDGNVVGDHTAENKALAEAAYASIKANETVDVDLTPYQDNEIIKNYVNYVKRTGTGNFVIEIKSKTQYTAGTPIVVMVVIDANGVIVNAQTVSHGETPSLGGVQLEDGKFNSNFIGKDQAGAGNVDLVGGVTYTTEGYKNAILNAFNVAALLQGGDVDFRTEEEKYADAIKEALPAGNGEFTKYFRVEAIEGFDAIYEANNGEGYVCVIGKDSTGTFIGVGKDGVAVGKVSAEHKALAEAAVAVISASEINDFDITEYVNSADKQIKRIFRKFISAQKTATGNYVFVMTCDGFGMQGDHYYQPSGKPFTIKVAVSKDGKILDIVTVEEYETPSFGGAQLADGAFNSNFIGKDETGASGVDTVTGCTLTTDAFKTGVLNALKALAILEGGTN